jgi:hypothetical protein
MDIGASKRGRKGQARHMPFTCFSGKKSKRKKKEI